VALVRFAVATPDETKLDGVETRLLDADGLELIGKDRQNAAPDRPPSLVPVTELASDAATR